jgi:membrane fusion protein, multidrug efflux system
MSTTVEIPQTPAIEEDASANEKLAPSRRDSRKIIAGIIIVLIIAICGGWYLYSRGIEDTDDAQVDGHLVPIAPRVEGTIQAVAVDDNQTVKAGTTLIQLDPQDYKIALDEAQAQYDQAAAQSAASTPTCR